MKKRQTMRERVGEYVDFRQEVPFIGADLRSNHTHVSTLALSQISAGVWEWFAKPQALAAAA